MQKDGNETDKDHMDTKEFNTDGERTGLGPEHRGCLMVAVTRTRLTGGDAICSPSPNHPLDV